MPQPSLIKPLHRPFKLATWHGLLHLHQYNKRSISIIKESTDWGYWIHLGLIYSKGWPPLSYNSSLSLSLWDCLSTLPLRDISVVGLDRGGGGSASINQIRSRGAAACASHLYILLKLVRILDLTIELIWFEVLRRRFDDVKNRLK